MKATFILAIFVCLGLAMPALCQSGQKSLAQMPASARRLVEIKITGSKRFPESAIVAASGLQIGTPVTDDDFKTVAVRLGDTGVFTDIAYSFSYSALGVKLEFHVTDANKFVPVRFEDFVWFPESEMLQRIKQHAPLFDGELPLSGRLAEEVSDVLQAMLVEKAIPGHVDFIKAGKTDGPVEAIVYQVSDVLIQIRNVEFTGAGQDELPALEAAAKRVFDREYSRTVLSALVQHQLLPVFYAHGYLKAQFGDPEPKVVKAPSVQGDDSVRNLTIVDVAFAVTPGHQYKLKSIAWEGNKEFPTDVLQKMVRAQPGEPANTVRLEDNLRDVQKLYGSRGFVTASIKVQADYDDSAGTVAMKLVVTEGYAYHMGDLEFRGLDNSLTAKLRNAWKIRPGEVYDATYLSEYLPEAHKLLPSTLDWDVSSHVTANARDKSVDVDLIYSVKAPK
ncbi:MAG TPA: POTRA domain-containing protein [Candidatus Sulfotelmatobacter sp.]|nr:POTRA domain-containing protein [Candidatus Sulfotelmatobacter sp.]